MLRSQKKRNKINAQSSETEFLPFSPVKKIPMEELESVDMPNTSLLNLRSGTGDTVDEEGVHISELRNLLDHKLMQSNMKCDHYSFDFGSQQNSLSDFGMDSELLKAYNQNRIMIQKRTLVATPAKRKDSDIDFCMSNERAKNDKGLWQMIEDCRSEKD